MFGPNMRVLVFNGCLARHPTHRPLAVGWSMPDFGAGRALAFFMAHTREGAWMLAETDFRA
jgi:hypothetical protein